MNSKEMVRRAIEFKSPERIPYNFDSNRTPVIEQKYGEDFEWLFVDADPNFKPKIQTLNEWDDEWGVRHKSLGTSHGEAVGFPLDEIEKLKDYRFPDFANPRRYKQMEKAIAQNKDKYLMGCFPHFLFLTMLDLFGFENLLFQLADNRDEVEYVADILTDSCLKVVDCMAKRCADGIIAIEDLGVQDRLIISPTMWREIFKPKYAKIIKQIHRHGMHFIIHSCGYIIDIIEDMIEIGVDVIQIDQQDNMGIEDISKRYKGRVCFFCPVDIQTTLATGTAQQIEQKAKELIKAFSTDKGGFIAKTYPQPESINLPEANTAYMCDVFKKFGEYPLKF